MSTQPHNGSDIDESFQKVAKGTIIVFIGTIIGIIIAFAGKVTFARFFTPSEYGIFSLVLAITNISAIIGTLGLREGTTRQIAYYRGKNQIKKAQYIVLWSLIFGVLSGMLISSILYLFSDLIAVRIFNTILLSLPIKIISAAIPFYILLFILISISRGFKRVKERVYFVDIIKHLLFPLLLLPVLILGLSFEWGIASYSLSIAITAVACAIYTKKQKLIIIQPIKTKKDRAIGKELLFFSLPLLLVVILYQVLHWTDILMLGYFETKDVVGFYNAANPLASFILSPLTAMIFILTPILSDFYAKGRHENIRNSYAVLTKWISAATLPIMLIFVLFPMLVLNFFFGNAYMLGGSVLQILAVGYFISNLMGPNGASLTAIGRIKFLMGATFIAACINVLFNILLIPAYGANGAAIATITSLVSINIIRSIKLYSFSKIHSFKKNNLKPLILFFILFLIIYLPIKDNLNISFWMLPLIFIFLIALYGISIIFTKSFDNEDINMLLSVERKLGLNFTRVKQILKRFL